MRYRRIEQKYCHGATPSQCTTRTPTWNTCEWWSVACSLKSFLIEGSAMIKSSFNYTHNHFVRHSSLHDANRMAPSHLKQDFAEQVSCLHGPSLGAVKSGGTSDDGVTGLCHQNSCFVCWRLYRTCCDYPNDERLMNWERVRVNIICLI